MKLHPDDPRLTAYALGELPADQTRALESELDQSPEARAVLDETRALAALLAEGLAAEAAQPADPRLADAVERHLGEPPARGVNPVPEPEPESEPAPANVIPLPDPEPEGDVDSDAESQPRSRSRSRSGLSWGLWITAAAACVVLGSLYLPGLAKSKAPATRLAALEPRPNPGSRSGSTVFTPATRSPATTAAPNDAPTTPPAEAANQPAPVATTENATPSRPVPVSAGRVVEYADAPPTPAPSVSAPSPRTESLATAPGRAGTRVQTGPADSAKAFTMSPELMKRYGLVPAPTPVAPATGPAAASSGGMDPALRQRYGLGPAPGSAPESARGLGAAPAPVPAGATPTRTLSLAESKSSNRSQDEYRYRPNPRPQLMPMPLPPRDDAYRPAPDNPGYLDVGENPFRPALDEPLSTFSLDVDTGSYANIRRFLNAGQLPPRDAVRLEEMINYFRYDVSGPRGDDAFGVTAEVAACPWAPSHRLVRLAVKARGLDGPRPAGNFVFLVDVSGSMTPAERLPLLKQALKALVRRLSPADRVAIVTYASSAGVHLPSTSGERKEALLEAIDRLEPGGSTNGEGGLRSAYDVAVAHFIRGGVNRVLLCTDGDFNVGISNQDELVRLIEDKARSGVFLTTLGVGTDNFKDALMRRLADRGNGSYHYLDSFEEAQRVLIGEMDATFVTVARDAKAQVEFNPARVGAWRLLGYEKRILAHQDFNDDTKDAGEIGAGHLVTVLYEIVPPGASVPAGAVDPLKYQRTPEPAPRPAREVVASDDLLTLKLRYQRPEGSRSTLLERAVRDDDREWTRATPDFRFAAAVASFGMLLRESPNRGNATYDSVLELGREGLGADPDGWRAEFLALVQKARSLAPHRR